MATKENEKMNKQFRSSTLSLCKIIFSLFVANKLTNYELKSSKFNQIIYQSDNLCNISNSHHQIKWTDLL